ncbi:MAG: hypothetical protein Unbinned4118contig1001_2 [Prokaryotic dsDNA virus sp.]|jgi:hypothetical protein|nr:MAG: hypothetical protein Unbinned4118contig1001_2 [Prokaryotic dsDNA virus sp.]|tara:strand:+ start:1104 stop:1433 length:330 start_codon:yes stop_codon:yes gene_type:complete
MKLYNQTYDGSIHEKDHSHDLFIDLAQRVLDRVRMQLQRPCAAHDIGAQKDKVKALQTLQKIVIDSTIADISASTHEEEIPLLVDFQKMDFGDFCVLVHGAASKEATNG